MLSFPSLYLVETCPFTGKGGRTKENLPFLLFVLRNEQICNRKSILSVMLTAVAEPSSDTVAFFTIMRGQ